MSASLLLLMQTTVGAVAAADASKAAAAMFHSACVEGVLRVDKANAVLVKPSEMPSATQRWFPAEAPSSETYIKFINPPSTYLIIMRFDRPKSVYLNHCVLASRTLTFQDAALELTRDTSEKPVQAWTPDMYWPVWTIDLPKAGYRKILTKDLPVGWVSLEVSQYAPSHH